jgi:GTP cyclohydrolase II
MDLGQERIKLLTNNPAKVDALKGHGIAIDEQLSLIVAPNRHNRGYLQAKKERMAHLF